MAAPRPSWVRRNAGRVAFVLVLAAIAAFVVARRLKPVAVVVTPVVRGKAVDAVYATGTVEAENRVSVKAKTSGSLAEVLVKEGTPVKKGDLLARIDNPAVTFDLKRGQAELAAASALAAKSSPELRALEMQAKSIGAELDLARQELARTEKLAATGAVTPSEVDRARSRVTQLEGQLAANDAQKSSMRIDLSAKAQSSAAEVHTLASRVADTEVRAPIDGVVLAKNVEIGEVVMVNETLFKVGDVRSLILEVSVDEADVARVHAGEGAAGSAAAVSLYAFPKKVFRGRVFDVYPDANRERKSFLAKVRLDAPPEGLRSGMTAEVNIVASEKDGALLAPSRAEADGSVWVVSDGRAHKRKVSLGIRDLLRVELTSGVAEGDAVVVDGQDKLEEGKRVSVTVKPDDPNEPMPDRTQPGGTELR